MQKDKREYDLENRLIDFAVRVIRVAETLPKTRTGTHISGQILRSGTSPAPNYGEAQAAESRQDFIHKMNLGLKELRETRVWLILIQRAGLLKPSLIKPLLEENEQLIAVFSSSVKTARQNQKKGS